MAWNSPLTAVANTTLTAPQWNLFIRDNLNAQGPGVAVTAAHWLVTTGLNSLICRTAFISIVSASETTPNLGFEDLDTPGPSVSVTCGDKALVTITAQISNTTAGSGGRAAIDMSGATVREAAKLNSISARSGTASDTFRLSWTSLYKPLNPGDHVFGAKYQATVSGTARFSDRVIAVLPF